MISFRDFIDFVVETAEKNGWIDHEGRFRPNFKTHFYPSGKPTEKPVNRGHAQSAARYFRLGKPKNYDDPVNHAMDHGWTRVYHDSDGDGVAEFDGDKIKNKKVHAAALAQLGKGVEKIDHAGTRRRHGTPFDKKK